MNIIFGDSVEHIPDSYTILELDTIQVGQSETPITAWCVVEKIPLAEFASVEQYKKLHNDLLKYYKEQRWNDCEIAIKILIGRWNGELDTFYQDLSNRIKKYQENPPAVGWSGIIQK
jgi:hypothetical protein